MTPETYCNLASEAKVLRTIDLANATERDRLPLIPADHAAQRPK